VLAIACDGDGKKPAAGAPLQASTSGKLSYDAILDGDAVGGTLRLETVGDFNDTNLDMKLTITGTDGSRTLVKERLIGKDLYLGVPLDAQSKTHGKAWALLSFNEVAQTFFRPQDFVDVLQLEKTLGQPVGRETLHGGVATKHYVKQIQTRDLARADSSFVILTGQGAGSCLIDELESMPAQVDTWVDDAGELRKLKVDAKFAFKKDSGLKGWHEAYMIELRDLGTPVVITAPPPEQVDRSSDLLDSFGRGRENNAPGCPTPPPSSSGPVRAAAFNS
jgi:hypothetical protein